MTNIMIHIMIHIMLNIMINLMIHLMTYIMNIIMINIMINVMTDIIMNLMTITKSGLSQPRPPWLPALQIFFLCFLFKPNEAGISQTKAGMHYAFVSPNVRCCWIFQVTRALFLWTGVDGWPPISTGKVRERTEGTEGMGEGIRGATVMRVGQGRNGCFTFHFQAAVSCLASG